MSQDAHKIALSRLCANVAEQHAKGVNLLTEANAAPDMGTVKEKLAAAMPLLSDLSASMNAIVQTATVMATGEMPVEAAEKPAEADPSPAAISPSAETAAAAPASSSDMPASTESTGDYVPPSDADASSEDAAATKRKR
ncbi:hypothetical protein JRF84_14040 [Methylobacterium organophilum]|jgi:hypothetical protein|uniref:hypothetical protein n=1 Tax=Methylobacterium organophilum TaxID=410 RepID=UPI0019D1E362|nr:hypothetical protein [Methylobacterium organophilum]MBN6820699.1 hypothetical protein [Methylobacterium organophilum]